MTAPVAFQTAGSFVSLGIESQRGTLASSMVNVPVESPQVTPNLSWMEDKGYRGSPGTTYDKIPGARHDTYEAGGPVFLDTFPIIVRSFLGSADTVTAAPAATTLSAPAAIGATTVSAAGSAAAGSAISIGAGGYGANLETHIVLGVTGTGPYTLTLATPLLFAHVAGETVTGQNAHLLGLENNPAIGNQPPSVSIIDFDGVQARQMLGGQGDTLGLTFSADAPLTWKGKWITNGFTPVATPSSSFSSEAFVPGYSVNLCIAGASSAAVMDGDLEIARGTGPIQTANGTTNPLANFAGPIKASGKFTYVAIQSDQTMVQGLEYLHQVFDLGFTNPANGHGIDFRMSQVQLDSPKVNRGKAWVEVETAWEAEMNAADAVMGGMAPLRAVAMNAQTTSY